MHLTKRCAGKVFYLEFLFRKSEKIQHNEIRLVSELQIETVSQLIVIGQWKSGVRKSNNYAILNNEYLWHWIFVYAKQKRKLLKSEKIC